MALPTRGGLISDRIAVKPGIHARTTFAEDSEEDIEALTQLGGARPEAHLESPSTRAARHAISSARESGPSLMGRRWREPLRRHAGGLAAQAQKKLEALVDAREFWRRYLAKHPADSALVD
jgi:hypothetical protein